MRGFDWRRVPDALLADAAVDLDIVHYGGSVVFLLLRSLAKQIELSTVANKTAMCPCALTLTNFDKDSRVGTLLRSMAGKDMKWPINFEAQPAWAAYSPEQLVYLTPDAADVLTELDPTKVTDLLGPARSPCPVQSACYESPCSTNASAFCCFCCSVVAAARWPRSTALVGLLTDRSHVT